MLRFRVAARQVVFSFKSVLDIGCGFGDFCEYITNSDMVDSYKGVDINKRLIDVAKKRFSKVDVQSPASYFYEFDVRNIMLDNYEEEQADIVTAFGLLNWKIKDNLAYTKRFIESAWKITKETLIVDFLSTNVCESYTKEDNVYYHNPNDVLDIAFRLSGNVVLVHNYRPIPQKEFMIVMRKR